MQNNVVFDTQIFLRALINPQSISGKLFTVWRNSYTLYIAPAIENEIIDVVNRPKIRAKFTQITDERIKEMLQLISEIAIRVEIMPDDIEAVCRDPKDDIFLACAKVAKADYLISEDQDLLVLEQHHSTRIINVVTFLSILES